VIQAEAVTIPVAEWSDAAIETAAAELRRHDLTGALVFLWLHDDLVFEEAESGEPLRRWSFDARLHCDGTLTVMRPARMGHYWDQSQPLLEACKGAEWVVLITPLPRYLTVPCCDVTGHCARHYRESQQRHVCREVGELREATVRWASHHDNDGLYVVGPHLELLEVAKARSEDGLRFLKDCFAFDGIHLTPDGYCDLFDRVAGVLRSDPWRYRPPMRYMPAPAIGPLRATAARRPLRERLGGRLYREFDEELPSITGTVATITVEEIRAAERGPWANDEVQYRGPVMDPSIWQQMRDGAAASGSIPARRPAGGRPG